MHDAYTTSKRGDLKAMEGNYGRQEGAHKEAVGLAKDVVCWSAAGSCIIPVRAGDMKLLAKTVLGLSEEITALKKKLATYEEAEE